MTKHKSVIWKLIAEMDRVNDEIKNSFGDDNFDYHRYYGPASVDTTVEIWKLHGEKIKETRIKKNPSLNVSKVLGFPNV